MAGRKPAKSTASTRPSTRVERRFLSDYPSCWPRAAERPTPIRSAATSSGWGNRSPVEAIRSLTGVLGDRPVRDYNRHLKAVERWKPASVTWRLPRSTRSTSAWASIGRSCAGRICLVRAHRARSPRGSSAGCCGCAERRCGAGPGDRRRITGSTSSRPIRASGSGRLIVELGSSSIVSASGSDARGQMLEGYRRRAHHDTHPRGRYVVGSTDSCGGASRTDKCASSAGAGWALCTSQRVIAR